MFLPCLYDYPLYKTHNTTRWVHAICKVWSERVTNLHIYIYTLTSTHVITFTVITPFTFAETWQLAHRVCLPSSFTAVCFYWQAKRENERRWEGALHTNNMRNLFFSEGERNTVSSKASLLSQEVWYANCMQMNSSFPQIHISFVWNHAKAQCVSSINN